MIWPCLTFEMAKMSEIYLRFIWNVFEFYYFRYINNGNYEITLLNIWDKVIMAVIFEIYLRFICDKFELYYLRFIYDDNDIWDHPFKHLRYIQYWWWQYYLIHMVHFIKCQIVVGKWPNIWISIFGLRHLPKVTAIFHDWII